MKKLEQERAIKLRTQGYSIKKISEKLNVSKSSVSLWVRNVVLSEAQLSTLASNSHSSLAIERRRQSRLKSEEVKRNSTIAVAAKDIAKTIRV